MPSLQAFGQDIWISDGESVSVAGFHRAHGDYPAWRWRPVRVVADGADRCVAGRGGYDGAVRFIVAPNSWHHLFIQRGRPRIRRRRPSLHPGLRSGAPILRSTASLATRPRRDGHRKSSSGRARQRHHDRGGVLPSRQRDRAVHRPSADFKPGAFRGWRALVAKLDRMTADEPQVLQKFRVAFTDRKAARAAVRRILDWRCARC